MKEEPAQEKRNAGRRTGPEEEEKLKKNRPTRRGTMEEEPAQEKRTNGRRTGPAEEENWKKNRPRRRKPF